MEKDKQDKRVYLGFIPAVLLCLTLISIYMVCGLFARYTIQDSNSDSGEVAAFVFNVKNATSTDKLINLNDINKPGKKVTYTFKVTNKDISNTVAEVDIGYNFEVKVNGYIPITCSIYKNKVATANLLGTVVIDKNTTSIPVSNTFTGDNFEAKTARTDTYYLVAEWPKIHGNSIYANGSTGAKATLTFTSWQID